MGTRIGFSELGAITNMRRFSACFVSLFNSSTLIEGVDCSRSAIIPDGNIVYNRLFSFVLGTFSQTERT